MTKLGFQSWAIVNDSANGHHALALVKDVERLARLVRTKPGVAKDGFEELAGRLGTSVPHFLPTFFEQAGRAFLEADDTHSSELAVRYKRDGSSMVNAAMRMARVNSVVWMFRTCWPGA